MTRFRARALTTALLAILAALLGGCGSATKTVSVSGAPTPAQTSTTQLTSKAPAHTTTTTTPTTTPTTPTPAPATRTAPEPEFAQQQAHGEGSSEAISVLQARGYTATEPAQYHANQTLRVLVGAKSGSSGGYGQQAFFFVGSRYIGTDTKEPSATVKVIAQSDTEVTLSYPLYRKGDPLSDPSGGQATVRFQLNNGKLVALDPIPPASSTTGPSRQ